MLLQLGSRSSHWQIQASHDPNSYWRQSDILYQVVKSIVRFCSFARVIHLFLSSTWATPLYLPSPKTSIPSKIY